MSDLILPIILAAIVAFFGFGGIILWNIAKYSYKATKKVMRKLDEE